MGESQRLLAGILSLVLIVGLGTPAFAVQPPSDTVVVTVDGVPFTCVFPESSEGAIQILEDTNCPGLQFVDTLAPPGSPGGVFVLTDPLSEGGGISDILILQTFETIQIHQFCSVPLCFVSDDDQSALDNLYDQITRIIPATTPPSATETGSPQDVPFQFQGHVTVTVQSDVEPPTPVGGIITPVDMTALFVAGAMTNAFWMIPTLGGIAGAIITLFKIRRKNG